MVREHLSAVDFDVDGALVVADPCYVDLDDGPVEGNDLLGERGLGVALADATGTWRAEVETLDNAATQGWGERVSKLHLRKLHAGQVVTEERVGNNGVDSGQMYAGPASDLPLDYEKLLAAYAGDFNRDALVFAGGIVSSTGYGDGTYPVDVGRDRDGKPVEVTVTFISDEDDEEF